MSDVAISPVASNVPSAARPAAAAADDASGPSFHDVLSSLNPLQYLPVIGTIYRALTGDQISEPMRRVGSIIAGGLLGGPIGAAIGLVTLAAEKVSGIDLDQTGQEMLTGHASAQDPAADAASAQAQAASPETSPPVAALSTGWSAAQLAAYGVSTAEDGTLRLGKLTGADALNDLELSLVHGFSPAEVRTAGDGTLTGAEALNDLELSHVRMAQSAYEQSLKLGG